MYRIWRELICNWILIKLFGSCCLSWFKKKKIWHSLYWCWIVLLMHVTCGFISFFSPLVWPLELRWLLVLCYFFWKLNGAFVDHYSCEGRCLRSFHATAAAGSDSICESLGLSDEQVEVCSPSTSFCLCVLFLCKFIAFIWDTCTILLASKFLV